MPDGLSGLAGIYVLQHKLICETNCGRIDDTPVGKICFEGLYSVCGKCAHTSCME